MAPKDECPMAAAFHSIAARMRQPGFVEGLPLSVGNEPDNATLGSVTVADVAAWEERKVKGDVSGMVSGVEIVDFIRRFRAASRHDLLVAFALSASAPGPASVTVVIGGQIASELTVEPGGWVYALRGRFPVPTVALQYHEVSVRVSPPELEADMRAVLAVLPDEELRAAAAINGFRCRDGEDTLVVSKGMLKILNPDSPYREHALPDMSAI